VTILVSGGTGYVGQALIQRFTEKKIRYKILSRSSSNYQKGIYHADFSKNSFDESALEDVHTVINLNGANIGEKRWSASRKQTLRDSRIAHTEFLIDKIKKYKPSVNKLISCSAIGYYGDTGETFVSETSKNGSDFMSELCRDWENASLSIGVEKCTIFRIGLVLGTNSSFEKKLRPSKWFRIVPLFGGGQQYISWIHIDDLVKLMYLAINDLPSGIYNAVSKTPIRLNQYFDKAIKSPKMAIPIPPGLVKMILGEMSDVVLNSYRVSPQKIILNNIQHNGIPKLK